MNIAKKQSFLARLSAFVLCAVLLAGMVPMASSAYEYTYQATFHAGNFGKFTSRTSVWVNNRVTGSQYAIDRASDGSRITVSGLKAGDVVTVDVTADGAVYLDPDSLYYVKGIRLSGLDNAEASYGAVTVDRDRDYVVAYGMRSEETTYTAYYRDLEGRQLADPVSCYGNVGDKPVLAYAYIEGYTPVAYNLTKTLVADPSQNIFTFYYKKDEALEVKVEVPGETTVIHVPGQVHQVNVPGQTIVQYTGSGQGGTVNDTGAVSGGSNGSGTVSGGSQGGTPSTVTYVLNTNSKKIHDPSCEYVPRIEAGNRLDSGESLAALKEQGYEACGVCNPTEKAAGNGSSGSGDGSSGSNGGNGSGDVSGTGTSGSRPSGDGSGSGSGGSGDVSGTGTSGSRPSGDGTGSGETGNVSGTGTSGERPSGSGNGDGAGGTESGDPVDGTGSGNGTGSGDGSGDGSSSAYKPGGSLDVVLSNDYVPSAVIDLDENPEGVPKDPVPGMDGNDGQPDPAQDGMNENTDGTGTGTGDMDGNQPQAGKPSMLPVVIIAVVVLAGAGAGVFFLYKKQQGQKDGDEE